MSSEKMRAHLEELEDLVVGQDVPVSYKKLSKQLNIHVNEAKKILPTFVKEKGSGSILETHLLTGKVSSTEGSGFGWHVCVVHKEDLDSLKKNPAFKSSSSHVYSVYRGTKKTMEILPEIETRLDELGLKLSGIENKNAAVKESKARKFASAEAAPIKKKQEPEQKKQKAEEKKPEVKEKEKEDVKKEEKKTDEVPEKAKQNNNAAASSKNTNNKKGGIANFFQRGAASGPVKKETKPAPQKQEIAKEKKVEPVEEKPEPKPELKKEVKVSAKGKASTSKAASKRKSSKSQSHTDKKRKRIVIESDSESSDGEERMEEDVEIEEPAPPTAVAVKEEEPTNDGICRERKLVDKVFKDENGFIVTKKTWVTTETKTEKEEKKDDEVVIEKETKKEEKPVAAAPVKKKQGNIMSFFTRK